MALCLIAGICSAAPSIKFSFSSLTDEQKEMLRGQEEMVMLPGRLPEDTRFECWLTYSKGNREAVQIEVGTESSRVEAKLAHTGSWRKTRRKLIGAFSGRAGEEIGIRLQGTACSLKLLEFVPLKTDQRFDDLLYSAIDYYEKLLRLSNGVYQNFYPIRGGHPNTGSTATIGTGLIALCLNHELGRDSDARDKALQTLRALNGKGEINIQRDEKSGFFLHFFNNQNGSGRSEYSTIDTSIMVSGAICCRNTFQDDEISREVDELFYSIDWMSAVADGKRMKYYTVVSNGVGQATVTQLFNEYLILAWLCDEYETATEGSSDLMPDIDDLPVMRHEGLQLPTEPRRVPLSSFVIQFPFYMCGPCANDPLYAEYMAAYAEADHLTCLEEYGREGYWGCGAGQTPNDGYVASSFMRNPGQVVSPRIVAGFMPVYEPAVDTLLSYAADPKRHLKTEAGILIPRFSMEDEQWRPDRIESIDFSSMMFGAAAMHPQIGLDFFKERFRFTIEPVR